MKSCQPIENASTSESVIALRMKPDLRSGKVWNQVMRHISCAALSRGSI